MARKMWERPTYSKDEIGAMQALFSWLAGVADEPPARHQARMAWDTLNYKICLRNQIGFSPEDPNGRMGAFIDGRQFVAKEMDFLSAIRPDVVKED